MEGRSQWRGAWSKEENSDFRGKYAMNGNDKVQGMEGTGAGERDREKTQVRMGINQKKSHKKKSLTSSIW